MTLMKPTEKTMMRLKSLNITCLPNHQWWQSFPASTAEPEKNEMILLVQWRKLGDQFQPETFKRWMSEYTKYISPKIAKADSIHPVWNDENF